MKKRFSIRLSLFFCVLTALWSCKIEAPKPPLVETVAVLLFDNESNDVNAADIMQRYVYLALKPSVYQVMDLQAVNEFLEKAGIIDGGQLPAIDPVKLGKDLGVQALLFGNVETFGYINIGFYTQRKVALDLKLISVSNGETLWEHSDGHATRQLALDSEEAKKNFARGLADQAADKLFDSPLEEEAKLAVVKTLRTLPGYTFTGFAQDDQSPSVAKTSAKGALKSIINNK